MTPSSDTFYSTVSAVANVFLDFAFAMVFPTLMYILRVTRRTFFEFY